MKKIKYLSILLTGLILFQTNFIAMANPLPKVNKTLIHQYSTSDVLLLNSGEHQSTYLFQPYDENSTEGYDNTVTIDGKQYLMRVRQAKLESYNSGPILNIKPIMSLSIGATKKVSETISSTQSSSIVRSVGTKFGFDIKFYVTIKTETDFRWTGTKNYSITNTISKDTSYSFPTTPEFKECNSVTFYSGFDHDKYNLTIDYVPIEKKVASYKVINLFGPRQLDPNIFVPVFEIEFSDGRHFMVPEPKMEEFLDKYSVLTPNYTNKIVDYVDYLVPIPVEYAIGRKI